VPQVMEAQPLHAGGSGSWDPDPAGEVAAADRAIPLAVNTSPSGPASDRRSGAVLMPRPRQRAGSPSVGRRRPWTS
jgi:hypothetical protein